MALKDIVNVQIVTQTSPPSQLGFGTPLVLGYHAVFPERARIYSGVDAMISDGFAADSLIVAAATAIFSQSPRVSELVVGRMANAPVPSFNLVPVAENLTTYEVEVNGEVASYTSDADATVAEITAGLKASIDLLAIAGVTTTDNTTDLDVEASAGTDLSVTCSRSLITRKDNTPDPGVVADLSAVRDTNDDFYSIHPVNNSQAIIEALAAHVETLLKIMVVANGDDDILDALSTTDVASVLKAAGYARTALIFHTKPNKFAGAAWAGDRLPSDPGSSTWKFKDLAGVPVDSFTETELGVLGDKNANFYHEVAGEFITEEGVTASGEFIDVTRFVDWLQRRMQERIYRLLKVSPKLPFTDAGLSSVGAEILAQLKDGITAGGLAADPEPDVTIPTAAEVPVADRANRLATGFEFLATLAGAIHAVEIQGTVTV